MRIAFDAVPDGTYDPLAKLADLYISFTFSVTTENEFDASSPNCRFTVKWGAK